MADYRDWCGSCGKEIVFGSHAPGCEAVKRVRVAERERQQAETDAHALLDKMTEDELLAFIVKLTEDRIALDQELTRVTRRLEFIRTNIFGSRGHHFGDKMRDKLKEKGFPGRMFF